MDAVLLGNRVRGYIYIYIFIDNSLEYEIYPDKEYQNANTFNYVLLNKYVS